MELAPRLHLVGSGDSGFGLTDDFDCHVYLVDGGEEAALVDAGIGAGVEAILANVEAAGVELERVRRLLLTHAHPDHSGGTAELRKRVPDLEVAASPQVADWVRTGDEEAMSLEIGKKADFYPRNYRFTASEVERELTEGDRLRVGDVEVEAIETPGHSDGHLAFLARIGDRRAGGSSVGDPSAGDRRAGQRTALFAGDLVFFGGHISLENTWDCRIQQYSASVQKLAGAGIDALLPGHHSLSLSDGQRHLDTAARLFDRGFVPKSVV